MDTAAQIHRENEDRVAEEYLSSLSDLNCNSKPLINMLTMLAEENIEYAPVIVKVVEQHIAKVPPDFKLPILYLIDSIIKNVKSTYVQLFSQCIVNIFCDVFEKVNEKTRERMYALRQTWVDVFSSQKLYCLDVRVKRLDQNWPITAKPPSIHVNPDFLKTVNAAQAIPTEVGKILQDKTRELLELKKIKLELELEATKKHLEQEKQLSKTAENIAAPVSAFVASEALQTAVASTVPSHASHALPSQMLPALISTNYVTSKTLANTVAVAPGIYPNSEFRSHLHTDIMSVHPQGVSQSNVLESGCSNVIESNSKNHPINMSLINVMRQRDPRLARQHQQRPQLSQVNQEQEQMDKSIDGIGKSTIDIAKSSNKPRSERISKSSNKISNRQSPISNFSNSVSLEQCEKTFTRDKGRNRSKRSGSKSSTTSASSASSNVSTERKNLPTTGFNNIDNKSARPSISTSCDKDAFEIAPLSTAFKQKSFSLRVSPNKSHGDMRKPNQKSHNYTHEKNGSILFPKKEHFHDIDLRQASCANATNPDLPSTTTSSEKKAESQLNNEELKVLGSAKNLDKKNFTATEEQQHKSANPKSLSGHVSKYMDGDDNIKKRPSDTMIKDSNDEPLVKKSKSVKLDELYGSPALFGSQDVDLRELMPAVRSASSKDEKMSLAQYITEDRLFNQSHNWDNFKGEASKIYSNKTTLDDVRAKLAKTAKLNIMSKTAGENGNKELSQRIRLAELQNMNEDTQEANDEKIRTMISQAQELLESKSITNEQHMNLLQTVMSINEANKLKIAKRQESLNAAREAVLKKRIPKLNKPQTSGANDQQTSSISGVSSRYEDRNDVTEDKATSRSRAPRDKRFCKVSKWSDRITEPSINKSNMWSFGPSIRPWVRGSSTSRSLHAATNFNMRLQSSQRPPTNGVSNDCSYALSRSTRYMMQPPHGPIIKNSCNSIDNPQKDLVRTIIIDGVPKEITFYDKVAIVFMELDQPHEINFQNGQRTIHIDNEETIVLKFNEDFKPITINGEIFYMRFGFPSRELYIDEHWYEIYFGGPPVTIPIRNNIHILKAEGPPPTVNIGALRRDLVVGKINMIVDAQNIVPLFLDARIQTFRLDNIEHTIQFADNLLTVLLNSIPMRVEYGGLPKSCFLKGKKYFVRFSALPKGVVAGKIQIKDMIYSETRPPVVQLQSSMIERDHLVDLKKTSEAKDTKILSENVISSKVPTATTSSFASVSSTTLNNINIDELFQKLVSSGILNGSNNILSTVNKFNATDNNLEEKEECIKPIDLSKPESIRKRQLAIVNVLYSGMSCSMCGIRFPQTNKQTNKYSHHLNWHYRQKRRERDLSRKARSRKWYYELNDWAQYEEVEDEEQLSKNSSAFQKDDSDIVDDTINQRSLQSPLPCCPAGPAEDVAICNMCHEKFEQIYNHDLEEWQLPGAIRVENKVYHPLCYEDFKASLNAHKAVIDKKEQSENDEYEDIVVDTPLIHIDGDNAVDIDILPDLDKKENNSINEEDDDVIVLPNEEPSVTEIVDDDEDEYLVQIPLSEKTEKSITSKKDTKEGRILNEILEHDVEIQEPCIPFTDLDTYNEDESNKSPQISITNVKIKEEPKGDDDEDDGFEDVGTVLISPDEISVRSCEANSQSHNATIEEQQGSPVSNVANDNDIVQTQVIQRKNLNIPRDENLEGGNERALSSTCPTPAMPLIGLINKIKINITKNTGCTNNAPVTSSSNNNSKSAPGNTSITTTALDNSIEKIKNNKGCSSNPIQTISTIPVLCSGGTSIPSVISSSFKGDNCLPRDNSVSTISVIGTSYVGGIHTNATPATNATRDKTDDDIQYQLKPVLQQVIFTKKEKIICGSETSGLCSIM